MDAEGLVAADVTRFVRGECRDGRVRGARLLTSGLRSLLHYLSALEALAFAVPRTGHPMEASAEAGALTDQAEQWVLIEHL